MQEFYYRDKILNYKEVVESMLSDGGIVALNSALDIISSLRFLGIDMCFISVRYNDETYTYYINFCVSGDLSIEFDKVKGLYSDSFIEGNEIVVPFK